MAKALMPGDRVAFLNEDGGGKVLSIIDDHQVMIELDEGFEIPVPKSQLVKVKDFTKEDEDPEETSEAGSSVVTREPQGEKGLFLAFDPAKGGDLLEFQLLNNTASAMYFTVFEELESGHYQGVSRGALESLEMQMIKRLNQSALNEWRPLVIQALPFTNEMQEYPQPYQYYFKPKAKSFFKALKHAPLLDREVYLFNMGKTSGHQPASRKEEGKSKESNIPESADEAPIPKTSEFPDIPPHTVDLHIEKLVQNPSKLEHSEILDYQMKCFEEALDKGLAWGYDRMVFIHGIGNGVLRERIQLFLKRYPHVKRFKEGGQPGTTEVWF